MKKLSSISENFAEWYQEVVVQAELIDQAPTRGCFVLRPYGYAIWENIQKILDAKIKKTGTQNTYFPLLIPESFIKREAKHIEGFSPELAVVTIGGGNELEEKLVVRPTSETIIYHMFARWITSWRDLPLKINQWANVVRWEMRTRPFVRSLEFLWQEGHTAHATREEAEQMALAALEIYRQIYEEYLAIPVIVGQKSENERFAGADNTYTIEGIMQDGKALQMCTSHLLAQSFPAAFDVGYQAADGSRQVPYCTSWGMTTRSIGALIMTHGDQDGLIFPPKIAPLQAVIVPIYKTDAEKELVMRHAQQVYEQCLAAGISVKIDTDEQSSPGAKFYAWELRGVPVRLEIGPKDIEKGQVTAANRAQTDKALKKTPLSLDNVVPGLEQLFDAIQTMLFKRAQDRMAKQWHQADDITVFGPILEKENGLYQTGWCGATECEAQAKTYKATIRCVLEKKEHAACFGCKQPSRGDILLAKAY